MASETFRNCLTTDMVLPTISGWASWPRSTPIENAHATPSFAAVSGATEYTSLLPRIGELVPPVEQTLLSLSFEVQYPGDDVYIPEVVELHTFVSRPLDVLGAGHTLHHVSASHDRGILGVDEVRREQPVECAGI